MAKMGAVRTFLNRANHDRLRSFTLEESFADKKWRENGVGARIGKSIVVTYDDYIEKRVREEVSNQAMADSFSDCMTDLIAKMDINK